MYVSRKIINKIIDNTSIPIIEGSHRFFNKKLEEFYKSPWLRQHYICTDINVAGIYNDDPFHRFIFLKKNLPNYTKLWVLLHEMGHHICNVNKCKCQQDLKLNELHATRYALRQCYNSNYLQSLLDYMMEISKAITWKDRANTHLFGFRKIVKEKKWQKYKQAVWSLMMQYETYLYVY